MEVRLYTNTQCTEREAEHLQQQQHHLHLQQLQHQTPLSLSARWCGGPPLRRATHTKEAEEATHYWTGRGRCCCLLAKKPALKRPAESGREIGDQEITTHATEAMIMAPSPSFAHPPSSSRPLLQHTQAVFLVLAAVWVTFVSSGNEKQQPYVQQRIHNSNNTHSSATVRTRLYHSAINNVGRGITQPSRHCFQYASSSWTRPSFPREADVVALGRPGLMMATAEATG